MMKDVKQAVRKTFKEVLEKAIQNKNINQVKTPFFKRSKLFKKDLKRFFVQKNNTIEYFVNESDTKPKKTYKIELSEQFIQHQTDDDDPLNVKCNDKPLIWHDDKCKLRIIMFVKERKDNPLYVYSNEISELIHIYAQVNLAKQPKVLPELIQLAKKMSIYFNVLHQQAVLNIVQDVLSVKAQKTDRFATLNQAMMMMAVHSWKNKTPFLKLCQQISESRANISRMDQLSFLLKNRATRYLTSSFRVGRAKRTVRKIEEYSPQVILIHKLSQLTFAAKNRKNTRPVEKTVHLSQILAQELRGFRCSVQKFAFTQKHPEELQFQTTDARIFFDSHSPDSMLVENLNPNCFKEIDFFTSQFIQQLLISDISMIATNFEDVLAQDPTLQKGYQIKIYGRLKQHMFGENRKSNRAPEFFGYSPLNRLDSQKYTIAVELIQVPIEFVRQHNKKGFFRIKLTQVRELGQDEEPILEDVDFEVDPYNQFYVLSKDYRLNFTELELKSTEKFLKISTLGEKFFVDPIQSIVQERYQLSLEWYPNCTPVPDAIKDFLSHKEIPMKEPKVLPYRNVNREKTTTNSVLLVHTVGEKNYQFRLGFTQYSSIESDTPKNPDQREGTRLLIGRYCLLDDSHQMKIKAYNQVNELVELVQVPSGVPHPSLVQFQRLKLIERYGVSIYNLNRLPEDIQNSHFEWTFNITTHNEQLLNLIQTKIQDAHVRMIAKKKTLQTGNSALASGKLICSIIQANDLQKSEILPKGQLRDAINIKPQVQVSIESRLRGTRPRKIGQTFITGICDEKKKSKDALQNSSWISEKLPLGAILDLGEFNKNLKLEFEDTMQKVQTTFFGDKSQKQKNQAVSQFKDDNPEDGSLEEQRFDDIFLKFDVYSNKTDEAGTLLLGSTLLPVRKLINLQSPTTSQSLLLLTPKQKNQGIDDYRHIVEEADYDHYSETHTISGTLQIETLFVADYETRFKHYMMVQTSEFKEPESYIHQQMLLQDQYFDRFNYALPLGVFNPVYHQRSYYSEVFNIMNRPRALLGLSSKEKALNDIRVRIEQTKDLPYLKRIQYEQDAYEQAIIGKVFVSRIEIFDFINWLKDTEMRPLRSEYSYNFLKMWQSKMLDIKYDSKKQANQFNWTQFLSLLAKDPKNKPKDMEIEIQTLLKDVRNVIRASSGKRHSLLRRNTFIHSVIEDFEKTAAEEKKEAENMSKQSIALHNFEIENLIYKDKWEKEDNQLHSNLYYLVLSGIPDQLRSAIWRELLKVKVIEIEMIKNFVQNKSKFNDFHLYDKSLTAYENYVQVSGKMECLAFKQIDEDVRKFKFSNSYRENCQKKTDILFHKREELQDIKTLLRCLTLWSRQNENKNEQHFCFTYGLGTMEIIQRLLAITSSAEDTFWIMVGIIRAFPRPFTVQKSVLEDDTKTYMRYEMIAFKTLLERNLPKVYQKLQELGLSIETLVYRSIESMYSSYFKSDVVFRLWDQIIYNLCLDDKSERKRGLWWLLSPAFIVLRSREKQILAARSANEIINLYEQGGVINYDPDWFVERIRKFTEQAFVEVEKEQTTNYYFFETKYTKVNEQALDFENARAKNSEQVQEIFKFTQAENATVSKFLKKGLHIESDDSDESEESGPKIKFESVSEEDQGVILNAKDIVLNHETFRNRLMQQFGQLVNATQNYSSGDAKKLVKEELASTKLQVAEIHLLLHQLSRMPLNQKSYKIKLTYGSINTKNLQFQEFQQCEQYLMPVIKGNLKKQNQTKVNEKISIYSKFGYKQTNDYLQIQILDNQEKSIAEAIININEIPKERFFCSNISLEERESNLNPDSFKSSLLQIQVSFFLKNQKQSSKTTSYQQTLAKLNKKMPERVDIFNSSTFSEQLQEAFEQTVRSDFQSLKSCFQEEKLPFNIVNEKFNFVENFVDSAIQGVVTFDQLQALINELLPKKFQKLKTELEAVFEQFTAEKINEVAKDGKSGQTKRVIERKSLAQFRELKTSKDMTTAQGFDFSLKQFLVTLILMSHCTLNEKLDLLYDIFVWSDGSSDGIKTNQVFEVIKTIFERCLYFWPSHELQNQVEQAFSGSISSCYKAYWTKDINKLQEGNVKYEISMQDLMKANISEIDFSQEGTSIELTQEIQSAFIQYFTLFGTKIVDFNADVTPYKNLSDLIGQEKAKKLLEATEKQSKNGYQLVLFNSLQGERFIFTVNYDRNKGKLLSTGPQTPLLQQIIEVDSISSYFSRSENCLNLQGSNKLIQKKEFIAKVEEIPMLANFMRAETLYRDKEVANTSSKKVKVKEPVICTFTQNKNLFSFEFTHKKLEIEEGSSKFVGLNDNSFFFEMNGIYEEDTLLDVRMRIAEALNNYFKNNLRVKESMNTENIDIISDVVGNREFYVLSSREQSPNQKQKSGQTCVLSWRLIKSDFERIQEYGSQERSSGGFCLALRSATEVIVENMVQSVYSLENFSNLSLYRHADFSYEWRPCRIAKQELKQELKENPNDQELIHDLSHFMYEIEFMHLQNQGKQLFKRSSDQIIFSSKYFKEGQRNFRDMTQQMIRKTYGIAGKPLSSQPQGQGIKMKVRFEPAIFANFDEQSIRDISMSFIGADQKSPTPQKYFQKDKDPVEFSQSKKRMRLTDSPFDGHQRQTSMSYVASEKGDDSDDDINL